MVCYPNAPAQRLFLICLLAASLLVAPRSLHAADMRDHAVSLNAIPADAAFYAAWVKNREQIEAIQKTNAWKKLVSIPIVQMGWMQVQTQWQYPTDERLIAIKKWIDGPDGKDLLQLLAEMGSDEIFVFGDKSVTTLAEVLMEMNSEYSRASFDSLREANDGVDGNQKEIIQQRLMEILDDHDDDLTVPTIVKGFRIQDAARAVRMLGVAEQHLRPLLENEAPQLAEQLVRQQVDGHELLTLTVSGEMIPWDEVEENFSESPELFEEIKELVSDKELVLAVGVVDGYVVLAMSDSLEIFEHVDDDSLLADTPEFKRLNQHADERVITIAYASEDFMQAVGSQKRSFNDLAAMGKGALSLVDLSPEQVEQMENDIDEFAKDLVSLFPEPGALAAVTFTTDRGYETYSYNWGEMPANMDASQPLTLIDHVGEDSIGWYVARGKQSLAGYDKCVEWCKRGFNDFEIIAQKQSSPDDWEEYEAVRDQALPLFEKLDDATRKYMIPGFADGQGAVVFEASATSDEWSDFMPMSNTELPLPTIAFVYGVSDAGAVRQGAAAYFDVVQQVIDRAHEAEPDDVPAMTLPSPNESSVSAGTIYSYELPAEWGVNERVAPNAGLGDSVLVLSLMPELSEKLLVGSRPAIDGPAAQFDRPLLSAGHFEFARFIEATKPWIDYGIQMAIENAGDEGGNMVTMVGMFKPQVMQFLDVLQVLDSYTAVTYRADDAWVTHAEMRIIDLED